MQTLMPISERTTLFVTISASLKSYIYADNALREFRLLVAARELKETRTEKCRVTLTLEPGERERNLLKGQEGLRF